MVYTHTSFVDSSLVPYHIICVRIESGNLKFHSFTENPDLQFYSKSSFTVIVQEIQIYSYCTENPDLQLLYNKSRFTVFIQQIQIYSFYTTNPDLQFLYNKSSLKGL